MNQNLYLWRIYQNRNNGYDTFSEAIVVAVDEESARNIHPSRQFSTGNEECDIRSRASGFTWSEAGEWINEDGQSGWHDGWTSPENVSATLVGEALPGMNGGHVVCASFHAG